MLKLLRSWARNSIYGELERAAQQQFEYQDEPGPPVKYLRSRAACIEAGWYRACFPE
jgi:hypothetical protein